MEAEYPSSCSFPLSQLKVINKLLTMSADMFASQTSVTASEKSESDQKAKTTHIHYAFLLVDAWCAYGVPFGCVQQLRGRLQGPGSSSFLDSVLAKQRESHQALTGDVHDKVKVVMWPPAVARVLEKWPVNSLWSEFLIELCVDDGEARNAQDQLAAFTKYVKWPHGKDNLKGFMACLQLWYYGMPVEKV
jgi:hypothetical protein